MPRAERAPGLAGRCSFAMLRRMAGVELVATGAELLSGRTVNTHAQRLAHALAPLGLRLTRETSVPDDRAAIADAVRGALARATVVVVTGGLGPTEDDVTREAVAELLGADLRLDEPSLERIRERCERYGQTLTESRRRQALVLEGAEVLPNPVGAAPGERLTLPDGRTLFLLPGPPREFEALLNGQVLRWLREHAGAEPVVEEVRMICGLGESDVIERLQAAGFDPRPFELAYCAAPGQLEVRLTGTAADASRLAALARQLEEILGEHVYSRQREDLAAVVARELLSRGATLAVAESCTGGLIMQRLTSVPGSSQWFRGGVVAYANDVKTHWLGVPEPMLREHGAVSEPVVHAMALAARERFAADYALATSGIAGPGGGTPEKPVGLVWWALCDAQTTLARSRRFPGDRELVRQWAAQFTLDLLRRRLQGVV
ncbi:MAG: competence/damage-inducible protein A [Kiritimatiellae bacterium]|nr:competence/damage-inducible protein A [Kiritimatiellia bacterium]